MSLHLHLYDVPLKTAVSKGLRIFDRNYKVFKKAKDDTIINFSGLLKVKWKLLLPAVFEQASYKNYAV